MFRGAAYGKEIAYGKRPHFGRDLFGKKGMYFVRLFKVGGHLGQELVGGDPHIDSKTQLLTDRILDQGSGLQWGAEEAGGAGHIGKGFIYRHLLNDRGKAGQYFDKTSGALAVQLMSGRNTDQIRTFAQSIDDGFGGADPIFFGGDRLGQDDTVAALPVKG